MQGLNFDAVRAAIEKILDSPTESPSAAATMWAEVDASLNLMFEATRMDRAKHGSLGKLLAGVKAAASRLRLSLSNAKASGPVREDWMRFARRDLLALKDELLALKEFMEEEADFLRFACLRAQLRCPGEAKPERLFRELHEAEAISERTWVLLMAQPNSWRKVRKDREISRQLELLSGWLLDLQEMRREPLSRGGSDDVQKP